MNKKEKIDVLNDILEDLEVVAEQYNHYIQTLKLTGTERGRLLGSGIRRYGFIDLVSDLAAANPDFTPPYIDIESLKKMIREIEVLRNISSILQGLDIQNNNHLLEKGDAAYRIALTYYNTVKQASHQGFSGANAIFNELKPFFKSMGRRKSSKPTEKQVLQDLKALMHGTKTGKILVENE
jgi:hypothetical protein